MGVTGGDDALARNFCGVWAEDGTSRLSVRLGAKGRVSRAMKLEIGIDRKPNLARWPST